MTPGILQNLPPGTDLINQFERVLQKALQNTSDTITVMLTREIHKVGRRTLVLEQRMDELDGITTNHNDELEALKENSSLYIRLQEFINRTRRSNLRVRGIPIMELHSTITKEQLM